MGILDDDVARVRETVDIAAVIGEHVALKRVGKRLSGLCPFHAEKTPSFSVNPELGLYYCFGCNASGDAITFVREIEHLDFVGAVERLAAKAGIQLRYDDKGRQDRGKKGRLVECMAAAVDFYHQRLLEAPDAGGARRYLRSRGFDGDVARRFQLGWAPDGWDELSRVLQRRKFTREEVVEAGLAFVNRANKLQDHFRGRLLFPIFDVSGEPVGFGGRALTDEGPKYVNSAENALYHKRRVLYGLHWAKGEVVARGEAVVCEGYTDVMACHLAGVPTAVATCGTALADDHVRLLKRFASRLVLAYDADAAGQAAAERFYAWEKEFELELAVAALPAGRDPADVWKDDPALLAKAVDEARPFLQFRLDRLLERADLSTPEGKARAANGVIALVAEHPDPLVRDQYAMQLSERLAIDLERLREAVDVARRRGAKVVVEEEPPPPEEGWDDGAAITAAERIEPFEREVLWIAVHHPELVPAWLDASHFSSSVATEAFGALLAAPTFSEAIDTAGFAGRWVLVQLAAEEASSTLVQAGPEKVFPDRSVEPEVLQEIAIDAAIQVVDAAARHLHSMLLNARDDRAGTGKLLLDELGHVRTRDDRAAAIGVAERLVGWITSVGEG